MTQITRLFDFPYYQQQQFTNIPDALVTKYGDKWVKTSTQEYLDKANRISRALLRMGIQKTTRLR
jgi:long-chain acyl-CoA synthetase